MAKTTRLLCALWLLLIPACGLLVEKDRAVVAEVAGEPIRVRDLQSLVREMPFEQRARTNDTNSKVRLEARQKILQTIVAEKLMVLEAESRRLQVSDKEIAQVLSSQEVRQTATQSAVENVQGAASGSGGHEHGEGGHSQREIEEARRRLLIEKLQAAELSEAALRRYYDEHVEEFMLESPVVSYEMVIVALPNAPIVDALHRLVTERGMSMFEAFEALGKSSEILFAGITPPMPLNMVEPSMRENVVGLRKGEMSEPFYYKQGNNDQYAVARLVRFVRKNPFVSMKDELRNRLFMQLIERLHEKYKVEYHYKKLDYRVGE